MKSKFRIISSIITGILGFISGGFLAFRLINKEVEKQRNKVSKFRSYYNTINQWLIMKNKNIKLEDYFRDNGYSQIAIYGMGELGNRLYEELRGTSVSVSYAIDKEASMRYSDIEVINIDDVYDKVDVIVVTPVFEYSLIKSELEKRTNIKIISLDDIMYNYIP